MPLADIRSLNFLGGQQELPKAEERLGRLELEGVRSHGHLTAAPASPPGSATCLVWQPRWSNTGSPLDRDVSGRIVYRDPPPKPTTKLTTQQRLRLRQQLQLRQQQQQIQQRGIVAKVTRVITDAPSQPAAPANTSGEGVLHLLNGDRIPCQAIEIDDAGVRFKSSVVDAAFVPHAKIKALELVPHWTAAALDEAKRRRLLTLPRMQKENPPTHLIVSTGGDFLRARLTSMTADTLLVESRLETKKIPRDRVACLIWLHDGDADADEAQAQSSDPPPEEHPAALRVQAVHADGVQLTFVPQTCTGVELAGASELLGPCRVELAAIDALNLGPMIDQLADEEPFHQWKLTDAVEPRYLTEDESGGASPAALASGLVGKPAPDVSLDLLDGGKFKLAEHRGHVVVLDFWASWCGPCMQAMPQVDAVAGEFADRGVELFAVNLQEDRTAAAGALERLKIHPAVALDVDGAAAEHYEVTAIPQTVVIDAKGNVAQLFVGGGPNFPEQLRAAIEKALTPATPPAP